MTPSEDDTVFGLTGFLVRLALRSPVKLVAMVTVMFIFAVAVGGALLFKAGMETALFKAEGRLGADLIVVPKGVDVPLQKGLVGGVPSTFSLPAHLEEEISKVGGIAALAPQYFLASAQASCCENRNIFLIGIDPAKDFTVRPWAKEFLKRNLDDNEILVGGAVMKAPGATFFFYGHVFAVAMRLEKTGLGFFDNSAFITLKGVEAMERSSRYPGRAQLTVPWGRPSALFVRVSSNSATDQVAQRIRSISPDIQVITIPDIFRKSREKIDRLAGMMFPFALLSWLITGAMLCATQILYWRDRREAAGILRTLGMSRCSAILLFGAESAVLSVCTALAGILAAAGILRVFSPYITIVSGYPFLLTLPLLGAPNILALLGVIVASCSLPAMVAVWLILRHEPYELIRRKG